VRKSHRGILFGQLDNGVQLMCTHFGLLPKEQKQQSQRLQQEIKQRIDAQQPFILAGDFNDFSMKTHNSLLKRFDLQECCECKNSKLARTFPSRYPLFALDRIYFSGLELVDSERLSGDPWDKLSDHCALFAEFALTS